MSETFTIVAFRYNQKNSILYHNSDDPAVIARWVLKALHIDKADVISIRRVYNGEIKSTTNTKMLEVR